MIPVSSPFLACAVVLHIRNECVADGWLAPNQQQDK